MVTRHSNTLDLIAEAFKKYRDKPAFTCAGHTMTFGEMDHASQQFASYLQNELGLNHGDRIAIQLPNILQYPIAFYGAIRAGLVIVNTNPLYTPRELKYQLTDSGARALVVLSNVAASAASIIDETPVEHVIVTNFGDLHPAPKRWLINAVVKYVKKMIPAFSFAKSIPFRKALATPAKELKQFNPTSDTLLLLQYTGGTTGVAKGAMLTHGNLASNAWQMITHMPNAFNEGEEIYVACLPLYHIYGLQMHALDSFLHGGHNILIPNPRDLASLVAALKDVKFTVFVGINTLFNALCRFEKFKQLDFSRLKVTASGGMALTEDASRLWTKTTGCEVTEGYGLTETSPVVCGNQTGSIQPGTIGRPLPETEIRVIDEEGNILGPDQVGELCVRGPQVMAGYWQKPEETRKVLAEDGWLKTGDMALIQKDGFARIVDRKKDMIIVSGFNVYPNEVEDIVCQHPDIIEAAAVGVPHNESGELVKLFVVSSNPQLTAEDVRAFCKQNLTAYKVPKIIEFRDTLPKSNVGKILRRELRDEEMEDKQ